MASSGLCVYTQTSCIPILQCTCVSATHIHCKHVHKYTDTHTYKNNPRLLPCSPSLPRWRFWIRVVKGRG